MIDLKNDFNKGSVKIINFINLNESIKEEILKWRNHDTIRNWMLNDSIINITEHLRFIKNLKKDMHNTYYCVYKDNFNIGVIYFSKINYNSKNAYLGLYSNPFINLKGRGKILLESLEYIFFEVAKFHTLKLEVLENNEIAINLYKKFNYIEEGRLKEFVYRNSLWLDLIIMGKIRE